MRLLSVLGGRTLLCLATLGFLLTMGISFLNLRKYEEIGRIELSDTTWVVAQTRHHFLRFLGTLDRYVLPTSDVSQDDLLYQLDIVWSRLPLFLEGQESSRYAAVPGLQDAARQLGVTLGTLEPKLKELQKVDIAAYTDLRAEFEAQAKPLDDLIVNALVRDEGKTIFYNAELERIYLTLLIAFAGVLASGTGLIILLLRENAAVRRAQATAQAASFRLRVAIDSIADGFALYDRLDCLAVCNEKFSACYGLASDIIQPGAHFKDILKALVHAGAVIPEEVEPEVWIADRLHRHRYANEPFEEKLTGDRWLRISERFTPDGGIVCILTDITELKRREAALKQAKERADQANAAKTAFLATMSHELRTPLNAIIGFSEMMVEEIFGPIAQAQYAGYVQDIRHSGRHLLAIINDILDMAKIEAGRFEIAETLFGLKPLIHETLKLMRARARFAEIDLCLELCADVPIIRGDPQLIRQILLNLYSNALKFTPTGGKVCTAVVRHPDGSIAVRITDTGIGIAPENLNRVLEPFVQLENHLQRRHDGTGLGLSLVKAMVELHGGRFELDSEVGVGTTATVILPACRLGAGTIPAPGPDQPASLVSQPQNSLHDDKLVAF